VTELSSYPPLIVGIGNPFRHDDGVGPWVAQRLARAGLETTEHAGDGTGLLDLFLTRPSLILIDATRSRQPPWTYVCLDAGVAPVQADLFHYSTHRFGLAEAVETARTLGLLPRRLIIHGIEGQSFGQGQGLSEVVETAAEALVDRLGAPTPAPPKGGPA